MSGIPFETLYPLAASTETEQLEREAKQIFSDVFEQLLAPSMQRLLQYGAPYLMGEAITPFMLWERLDLLRSDADVARASHLYKAWKIENKKRGLDFLQTYLQMLFPHNWKVEQLYQTKNAAYPTALFSKEAVTVNKLNAWLTSRVAVTIFDPNVTESDVLRYMPVLQSIVAARFVLNVVIAQFFNNGFSLAMGVTTGQFVQMDFNSD